MQISSSAGGKQRIIKTYEKGEEGGSECMMESYENSFSALIVLLLSKIKVENLRQRLECFLQEGYIKLGEVKGKKDKDER